MQDALLCVGELYLEKRLLEAENLRKEQQLQAIAQAASEAQQEIQQLKEKLDEMGRAES